MKIFIICVSLKLLRGYEFTGSKRRENPDPNPDEEKIDMIFLQQAYPVKIRRPGSANLPQGAVSSKYF